MAIEYAISAGPGTLIDYGVADEIRYDIFGPLIRKWHYEYCLCKDMDGEPELIVATECPDDCETGR